MFARRENKFSNAIFLLTYNHNILIAYGYYDIMIKKVFVKSFVCFYDISDTQRTVIFCSERFRVYSYLNIIVLLYRYMFFFFHDDESSYKTFSVAYFEFYTYHAQMWWIVKSSCFFRMIFFFFMKCSMKISFCRLFEKVAFSFDVVTC